jgi:hypothetical protein
MWANLISAHIALTQSDVFVHTPPSFGSFAFLKFAHIAKDHELPVGIERKQAGREQALLGSRTVVPDARLR